MRKSRSDWVKGRKSKVEGKVKEPEPSLKMILFRFLQKVEAGQFLRALVLPLTKDATLGRIMKKYLLLHVGYTTPTPEIGKAWGKWFAAIGDKIIDGGSPLGNAKEIRQDGTKDLQTTPLNLDSITGYTLINAEDMAEALTMAESCPFITGIRVYEAVNM